MQFDVFICHASEDKDGFVRPLAEILRSRHIDVWYDQFSLSVGDSLSQKIDEGLSKSRFGIVVLSPNFFNKPWAKRELNGLTFREMLEKRNLILPIWHKVTVEQVARFSPPLADKKAVSSSQGINVIARELVKKIKPDDSPLIVARDHLFDLDVDSPPISDEWWLDIIEYKEFLKFPDINDGKRWIFPLPFPDDERGFERGRNIASTALQMDWSFDGEELKISPTTHPDKVHEYIRKWPGLFECARENAGVLAMYAPQLTIPGFDKDFEDVFDNLLEPNNPEANRIFSYGGHSTTDGKEPLCGDIIAYRHPTLGNYTPNNLGRWYFDAHDMSYIRSHWELFDGLVWLLCDDSNWLPDRYRQTFIAGILERDLWLSRNKTLDAIQSALWSKTRKQFKLTRILRNEFRNCVQKSIAELGLAESSDRVTNRILDLDIFKTYYDYQDWIKEVRRRRN